MYGINAIHSAQAPCTRHRTVIWYFAKASKIEETHGKLVVKFDDKFEMFQHLTSEMARLIDLTLVRSHFVSREKRATPSLEPSEKGDVEEDG